MNELINDLVLSLKEEAVYKNYNDAKIALEKHRELLLDFKNKKEEYLRMRPYFKYQDFSELKAEVEKKAKMVSALPEYQCYQQASSDLEKRLNELTGLIFKNLPGSWR